MVRAVLLGVLATAAVAACGKNDAAPAAQPGAVAGKVLEVSGSVTVAGHALAIGDAVKTDDAVTTGADGNVVIELAHNQARWELGPNHQVKPTDSLAWTAAAKTGSAARVDQDTSAAGRPAERSAADTAATSRAPVAPGAVASPPAEERAKAEPPPTAQPSASTGAPAPPPPPPPPPSAEGGGGAKKSVHAAPAPQIQPLVSADANTRSPVATPSQSSITTLQKLSSCVAVGSSVHVTAHVASHTATIAFVGDVDAKVQKCITAAVKKLTLTLDSGDLDVTLTR